MLTTSVGTESQRGFNISAFALAAAAKDKRYAWPPLPKDKRYALHWHAAKDKKLRVAMVLPSSLLPGFNISAFALAAAAKDRKLRVALARSQR